MATGIGWMVLARLLDRGIGVVSTLILARLLVPSDFGLVSMATALAAVLELFGAFSFDLALIQNKNAGRRQYDTVWTFNVLFGAACGMVFAALAIPAAHYYREPRLEMVIYVLAATYVFAGFSNVGVVNFRRDLQFRTELKFMLSRRLVTFVVTVGAPCFAQLLGPGDGYRRWPPDQRGDQLRDERLSPVVHAVCRSGVVSFFEVARDQQWPVLHDTQRPQFRDREAEWRLRARHLLNFV